MSKSLEFNNRQQSIGRCSIYQETLFNVKSWNGCAAISPAPQYRRNDSRSRLGGW